MASSKSPAKTPGSMSSRLANMKFMQRTTPSESPSNASTPPAKRQKLDNGSTLPAQTIVQPVPEVSHEEIRRERLLARQAEQAGDSKWSLDVPDVSVASASIGLAIVDASYGFIDSNGAQEQDATELNRAIAEENTKTSDRWRIKGRKSFGQFNKTLEKQNRGNRNGVPSGRSASEASSFSGESENANGGSDNDQASNSSPHASRSPSIAGEQLKAKRKAQRRQDKIEADSFAERRRSKEVNLNRITSISSGGGSGGGGGGISRPRANGVNNDAACFTCGSKGHMKKDCPKSRRR